MEANGQVLSVEVKASAVIAPYGAKPTLVGSETEQVGFSRLTDKVSTKTESIRRLISKVLKAYQLLSG